MPQPFTNSQLEARISTLKKVSIFAEIDEDTLKEMAQEVEEVNIASGETLFKKGDKGDAIYIVIRGELQAHDEKIKFKIFEENTVLGDFSLLAEQDRATDVTALTNSQLLKISEETFNNFIRSNLKITRSILKVLINRLITETDRSERLLQNILPYQIAEELKTKGSVLVRHYDLVSVLFTDFKDFTKMAAKLSPVELISELNACFGEFDRIIAKYNIEKIKTIGDAYMCAGGLPEINSTNPLDVVQAGLEIQRFIAQQQAAKKAQGEDYWECRLGITTGELVAGVIGKTKFAYDVWGNTVNLASRMESYGEVGQVNISGNTYNWVKDFFEFEYRGKIPVKGKGEVEMYFVKGIKAELSQNGAGIEPNEYFEQLKQERFLM